MSASPQISTPQVLPQGLYTARELRLTLARYRQRNVPDRTLRWWRNQLGIEPTSEGFYTEQDLAILIQLVRWLGRGGTVKQFFVKLQEKVNASES
ncbi:helix-turn-helix domain-containing protein (plasmid) [Kovacikia minuta CCNUW1]|uniref:helix-turn-helix domain-containing protein n=1 Tax=Kovacikia minuta TaxID=2931930 RepID=UPI001CCB6AA3|nr:helix-turn-helix domain-containing protein [Kovacikia minuta]UBF30769.1 helix-turn-helix domain-containing protein [Kovacikia minuta CCNUW1]